MAKFYTSENYPTVSEEEARKTGACRGWIKMLGKLSRMRPIQCRRPGPKSDIWKAA
ncbi:hypothetical protein CLV60_10182 [Dyadobacter jiangsuensis]|uniref:Uncharacterized protein n=1 Tax=Dyadobacter jiangsuensis TaxID=1591085 RepID=A0A2P8GIB3_9BACT|nr:hypothetical protein CLV60_10182 [Dyadobacter jiangsuensis]